MPGFPFLAAGAALLTPLCRSLTKVFGDVGPVEGLIEVAKAAQVGVQALPVAQLDAVSDNSNAARLQHTRHLCHSLAPDVGGQLMEEVHTVDLRTIKVLSCSYSSCGASKQTCMSNIGILLPIRHPFCNLGA